MYTNRIMSQLEAKFPSPEIEELQKVTSFGWIPLKSQNGGHQ